MTTYAQAQALSSVFVSGATDPAFDGSYDRYRPRNGPSASFHHGKWPGGTPQQARFTIATHDRARISGFGHFPIRVECDGTNAAVHFNLDTARRNPAGSIIRDCIFSNTQNAFYDPETDCKSIGVMALQGFSKTSGVLVTTVSRTEQWQNLYPNMATEVGKDHSLAFTQLSSH